MLSLLLALPLAALQQDFRAESLGNPVRESGVNDIGFAAEAAGWDITTHGRRRAMRFDRGFGLHLGSLAGLDSEATSISPNGFVVVGWSKRILVGSERRRPFRWTELDGMEEIPMTTFWGNEAWAEDVGLFGATVVGTARRFDNKLQAWEYNPALHTEIRLLGTIGGWSSEALTTDDAFVGGLMREPDGREHAVLWDRFRNPWFINTPGTGNARVTDIAINGQLTGWFEDANGNARSFTGSGHSPSDPIVVLPTLGGSWSRALATDGAQFVMGESETSAGEVHAFLYDRTSGEIIDINDRIALEPGTVLRSIEAISGDVFAINTETPQGPRAVVSRRFRMDFSGGFAGIPVSFSFRGGPGGEDVYVLGALSLGVTPVPGCPGLHALLDSPRILDVRATSSFGTTVHSIETPRSLAGTTVWFQGVMPSACITSNFDAITFI